MGFTEMMMTEHTSKFPIPALTVDAVVLTINNGKIKTILIRRGEEPFKGRYAFAGGHVNENEPCKEACRRELAEELHINVERHQCQLLGVFDKPGRDPRGWYTSIAYLVFVPYQVMMDARPDDDADGMQIVELKQIHGREFPKGLAFDHNNIVEETHSMLHWLVSRSGGWWFLASAGRDILGEDPFTATQLREMLETLGICHAPPNWLRECDLNVKHHDGYLIEAGQQPSGRRAKLYKWRHPRTT